MGFGIYIYNQPRTQHFNCEDMMDSIVLNEVHESNVWLFGEMINEDEAVQEEELVFDLMI